MNKKYVEKIKKIKVSIKEIENKLYNEEDPEEILYLKKQLRKWSIMFNILDFKTVYLESDHMEFLSSQHPNKYINKTMLARQ